METATNTYEKYYAINQFFVLARVFLNHFLWLLFFFVGANLFWQLTEHQRRKKNTHRQTYQGSLLPSINISGFMCMETNVNTNNYVPQNNRFIPMAVSICLPHNTFTNIYEYPRILECLFVIPFMRFNVASGISQETLIKCYNLCSGTCHVPRLIEMKSTIDISLQKKIEFKI